TAKPKPDPGPDAGLRGVLGGPSGLGTSAVRLFWSATDAAIATKRTADQPAADRSPARESAGAGAGAGSSSSPSSSSVKVPELYGPDALRDDPALGDAVDDRLVDWWGGE